ncbi:hypothetical protein RW64_09355 [Geobacter sulfurreducens]|nr:hypothetical protein RW64_09355 [Geobacter sulfurreducens]
MNQQHSVDTDALTSFQQWLNSDTALPVLRSVAKSVLGWAKGDHLIHEILSIEKDDPEPELGVAAYVLEFLFDEKRLQKCRVQVLEHLESGNLRGVHSILTSRIINFCKDERRKEANSPFHHHYRVMSRTLSADKETRYVYRKETGAYYAVSKSLELPFLEEGFLGADDFHGWPAPGFPLHEIRHSKVQLAISRTFWGRAQKELDQEHFLPVIDLVRYMDNAYDFSQPMKSEGNVPFDDGETITPTTDRLHDWQPHDSLNTLSGQQPMAERNLLRPALVAAAVKLGDSWKPITRTSFYFHLYRRMTLRETAERLGLKSPQAVSYHADKAESAIKEFFRQWQIAGYEGEKPSCEEQRVVIKALIEFILKNHPECRDEE